MEVKIAKRRLSEKEVSMLVDEIRKFPNPLTGKKTWQSLQKVYILSNKEDLIGVCGVNQLDNWVKLGPFVVLKKYHHKGYGKKILETIVKDYSKANLYIGSRNPAVAKIAISLGFHEANNIWTLPNTIRLYLVENILQNINIDYIKQFIRKKPTKEGPYRFFLRQKN